MTMPQHAFAEALVKAQGEVKAAVKDVTNAAFGTKSKYADLGSVWEAVKPALQANGFAVTQTTDFDADGIWLITTLLHISGEKLSGRYPLKPVKQDPQGYGSAMTYARRYCLAAMLGVVADEDDDGNAASAPAAKRASQPRQEASTGDPEQEDQDVNEGVKNWVDQAKARIAKCKSLPELWDWQDTNKPAMERLEKKRPIAHADVKNAFQKRHHEIGSQEP